MRDQAVAKRRRTRKRTDSTETGPRLRWRAALRWAYRLFSLLVYLLVLILSSWLLYYSVSSPYFSVRDIAVSGNRLLDAESASEAAGALDRNPLLLNPDWVEDSLRRVSIVKDAAAEVSLPGQLAIVVTERTPLVRWQAREGSFLVDREGIAFSEADFPVEITIRDVQGTPIEIGSRVDPAIIAAAETLDGALRGRAGIQPAGFDYAVSEGLSFLLPGGTRVVVGNADDLEWKLSALAAITGHLEASKARADLIDLRFRDRPVYAVPVPTSKPAATAGPSPAAKKVVATATGTPVPATTQAPTPAATPKPSPVPPTVGPR